MQNRNTEFLCVRQGRYLEVLGQRQEESQIILDKSTENKKEEKRLAGERQYEFGISTTQLKISSNGVDKRTYMKKNL